jgi:hypothetical protein
VRLPLAHSEHGVRLTMWGMNLADTTGGRKTTVNQFGCSVISQALGEDAIMPWKGSPEAFIQALARRDGQASVFARDEYTGLLAQMKRGGYVAGLAQDFIRAYDGLPITMARTAKMNRETGKRVDDTDRVKDPYLVKLCAATRTSFIETASIDDVLDGLLARFVFTSGIAEERPPQRSTPALETAWHGVVKLAQKFRERAEELLRIGIPDDVLAAHWELEKQYKAVALRGSRPEATVPAMKRLAENVLKVAALLAIDGGRAEIDLDDLTAAAAMARRWLRTTLALIADLGRTKFQARCDAVLGTISTHKNGMIASGLYRAHRDLDRREFENITEALEMQGLIHSVETTPTPGKLGRPPKIYFPGAAKEQHGG